jgi:pilus assembly protein CpaF
MFAVVITEKGGSQRKLDFDKTEVTIGRVQGNDIILPKGNVSKRHSRIVLKDNRFIVVDLKSTNGTYVNGRKITSPLVVKAGDKIYIGDFIITLEEPAGAGASPGGAPPPMPSSPMSGGGFGGGPPPLGGGGAPPPMPGSGGMDRPGGPPPLSPMSGGMGGPPPMPGGGLDGPRPPTRSAPPPPRTMGAGSFGGPPAAAPAPPPLPRHDVAPSEPPPMPPGGDRFALDEEPAEATPAPRVVAPARSTGASPQPVINAPAARAEAPAMRAEAPPPMRAEAPPPMRAEAPSMRGGSDGPRTDAPPSRADAPRLSEAARPVLGGAAAAAPVAQAPINDGGHVHEFRTIELGPEGMGPLGPLLDEVGVLEIVVEGTNVLVDRGSGLASTGQRFGHADSVTRVARHLLSRARVQLDASHPVAEATLPDGMHILAILPPVAVGGALVEIRRVGRPGPSGDSLVSAGMLSADMLRSLRAAVSSRRNILVIGTSDAGVAQLVGALAAMSGPDERVLVVEAMSELPIANPRAVRLAAAGTDFGALLTRAARLRADRVIVDGIRGGEAREALVLAGSRGGGTIVGVRAATGSDVIDHLEALASLSGGRDGVEKLVSSTVQVVVRLARGADGVRRVETIAETTVEGLTELFEHGESGFASTGQAASFG